ncbi:transcriptional regulator [Bifidobacterium goeldii]|nr:transcriptional regulator [Bifidobacterium goeldii]
MDVTGAVLALLPDGLPGSVWKNSEPGEADMPPWVIATCTTIDHARSEAMRFTAHSGRLEVRVASHTDDAVNVICDDKLIPVLDCHAPDPVPGYSMSPLILYEDSGSYPAGLTADDTSRRYRVRVLRFRFTWNQL